MVIYKRDSGGLTLKAYVHFGVMIFLNKMLIHLKNHNKILEKYAFFSIGGIFGILSTQA